jgi:phosphomannomutase
LVVLELMSRAGVPLSELLAPYRRYADSGEINTEVADPAAAVEAVARRVCSPGVNCDRTDGLTVDYGDWWFNLRPSNTEPLLRLNVEAATEAECQARLAEVLELVAAVSQPSVARSTGG